MGNVNKGNFSFVDEIYPSLSAKLKAAESLAYIDCVAAGRNLRNVYEEWLRLLVKEYAVSLPQGKVSLNDRRNALNKAGKLPQIKKYQYRAVNGEKKSFDGYKVWQKFGNQCSHSERKLEDPDVIYENLEVVLRIIHEIFRLEYIRKKGEWEAEAIGVFDPFMMPIGDNYVIKSYVPIDQPVSNCIREYETCSYNETGRVYKYGIVRVFQKKDMDEKLLQLRDQEAFSEAEAEAGIQFDGNVQVEVLSKIASENSSFYVVIYKFSQKPERLGELHLTSMSLGERIRLCEKISRIVYSFHNLSVPIYHRNLSFDSIYVCKNSKGDYEPSIIKLDCAKIASEEFGTVIVNVQNMQTMIQQRKILKYAAPEVRMLIQKSSVRVRWDKADVYSLGVMFSDIINGQFDANVIPTVKLQRMGVDLQLLKLIDEMRNPNAELRPSVDVIIRKIEEMDY